MHSVIAHPFPIPFSIVLIQHVLKELIETKSDQKIEVSTHIRIYPGAKTRNTTAFYFKTKTNYHFVVVNEKTLQLEVKTVAAKDKENNTYTDYLSFGPEPLDKCPDTLDELKSIPVKRK